ncbi:MAG: methyltransferase domain-containing protein, partial [Sulfurovum sp.]
MKDKIFDKPISKKFEFDESVASVFDDMISRSVPYYDMTQKLMIELILASQKEGKSILDLGSSTGKFLIDLSQKSTSKMNFTGMDNSQAMLDISIKKANAYGADINFIYGDILSDAFIRADIIISNYTLQFIRPL